MINNGMSWLSLGNYINPKARNTELSNDYNQLTNRPIITLTGTSQNPIKLWKLDVGLYILNGYVQHTDALLSEARGLFVSATVGIVNGKYVISAFIPFWEGQYEYILPSLSSETYTEHQMIRMITQGNSLTLDNIREYFPTQDYHPTTKKYVDETMDAIRNELGKMGLSNNDVQSLIKENRRRDIAIQALLSQNSDKMVTIDEEVHNISMDYSLDKGIATINTLEGDTLVNVSKDTEYDKVLSYEQDIVENTNTVDLEVDGNLNPIIVGDTLVNVCTQNNPTAITNEYTVEGNNHFALQDEVEGNCRPIIQGNTIVNRSKTKDSTPLTTYVSEVEGNEMSLVNDTDTHVRVDKLVGDTMVNLATNKICPQTRNFIKIADNTYSIDIDKTGYVNQNIWLSLETLQEFKDNTTYTIMFNIIENTLTSDNTTSWTMNFANYTTGAEIGDYYNAKGLIIKKFTTNFNRIPEEAKGFKQWQIVINKMTGGKITIKNPMLFEGDYTNKPIPQEYFEGLKNSYEDKCIEEAKDLSFTITGNSDPNKRIIYFDDTYVFKPNTTYTVMLDLTIIEESDNMVIRVNTDRGSGGGASTTITKDKIKENHIIRTITTNNNVSTLAIYHITAGPTYGTSLGKVMINKLCILEGDYSSNPLIYEEVMEHSGQYRCKVEVQGENYNQTQTVYLNSPLLKGDEVVYKEGKLCHYHKRGKVVLDGSDDEGWITSFSYDVCYCSTTQYNISQNATTASSITNNSEFAMCTPGGETRLGIKCSKLGIIDKSTLIEYLQTNPMTVVYELANPYYETISTSELLLPITTNCKLLTSSNIPLTTMSTRVFTEEVNILANTQYSLNFNSDVASTVNITLGGTVLSNQAIVKGYNKFSITTPSTLVDNNSLLIIEGSGVNISEVVVTEYDEGVCEYIEGLKSSFEDCKLPSKNDNLIDIPNIYLENSKQVVHIKNVQNYLSKGKLYTISYIISKDTLNMDGALFRLGPDGLNYIPIVKTYKIGRNTVSFKMPYDTYCYFEFWNKDKGVINISDIIILEGDWTHLTEEDWNNLGKYKVEYKVVGKNKCSDYSIDNSMGHLKFNTSSLVGGKTYKLSFDYDRSIGGNTLYMRVKGGSLTKVATMYQPSTKATANFIALEGDIVEFYIYRSERDFIDPTNLQIEEGTVATEYEPYKESTQTVYLNSPLLEGDTIEEIDGEVYHVKKYYKTILNGSEYWCKNSYTEQHEDKTYIVRYSSYAITPKIKSCGYIKCDKVTGRKSLSINYPSVNDLMHDNWAWYLILSKNKLSTPDTNGLKQWLSENPITVVYELATPTYELIPSSSIVCKSYPNGHLDFNTNVHIDNTVNFVKANLPITYANTSTNYKLQFVSDKDMENVTINALGNIMENVTITKGLNKISFTSPSDATNILTFEGLGYAYISNVQLVATEKDIDYFKGLYSTYECGLIEDESNENYGKYEVNIVSHNAPIQFGKGGKIE